MIIKNILIHWETTASSKLTVTYIELKDNKPWLPALTSSFVFTTARSSSFTRDLEA